MQNRRVLTVLLAALGVACAPSPEVSPGEVSEPPEGSVASPLTAYPNSTFYIVTRPDLRKCAYPLCGGSFAQRVNRGDAVCADGTTQTECRILEFDYSALKLDPGSQSKLTAAAGQGQALLRGTITKTAPIAGRTYDKLVVQEAWIARALQTPGGMFSRVRQLPLACPACATFQQELLNSPTSTQRLHSLVFDKSWPAALVAELQDDAARHAEGVLFAGVRSTSGGRQLLTVSEGYTPFPAYPPVLGKLGEACGWRGRPQDCEAGLYCKRLPAAACGRFDAPGTCTEKPTACTTVYKPVCGCDAMTYGNECEAGAAGISVDHEGACP
jgi:hypothetical protein